MHCAFLYNPNSGKGKLGRKIGDIEERLREMFGEVTAEQPDSPAKMTERARFWARNADVLVFAGGDGTFNAVLEGTAGSGIALGYLPAGTANDAAGSLGIPKSVRRALNTIERGETARVDCMRIGGTRYAIGIVAAGSLTRVTYETAQTKKRVFGWFAYALGALKRLCGTKPFYAEIACGGTRSSGSFALALILNGKKVARFSVCRDSDMRDGLCEGIFVRQSGCGFRERWGARLAIVRLVLFGAKHGGKRVLRTRGATVTVRKSEGVLWDFDGERGTEGELDVHVLRGAVKVFVPRREKNKKKRKNA